MSKLILIFSDLDGTMLSHLDYSYGELKTIIKELGKEKDHYVIIPCTSKTEIEVLSFGKNVGLSGPFIVENGGKIITAQDGVFSNFRDHTTVSSSKIQHLMDSFPLHVREAIRCFHELSAEEIGILTGLNKVDANNAKIRNHSVVFALKGGNGILTEIKNMLKNTNYKLEEGGRFFHIIGKRDKAKAAQELIQWIVQTKLFANIEVWALGDAPNDLDLLKLADKSAIIKNEKISQENIISLVPSAYVSNDGAPKGWQESLKILKNDNQA